MTTILAAMAIGTTAFAPPAQYKGIWESDSGDAGTITLNINGSLITADMKNPGKDPSLPTRGTANMAGSVTGHRFKVTVTYSNGLKADYQGNIDTKENKLRMDGLKYVGDKPDVKMRFMVDAKMSY